jgi:hypothetical protein
LRQPRRDRKTAVARAGLERELRGGLGLLDGGADVELMLGCPSGSLKLRSSRIGSGIVAGASCATAGMANASAASAKA